MNKELKVLDEFVVGKHDIGYVSNYFYEKFAETTFKKGAALQYKTLEKLLSNSDIKNELGAEECTLGDVLETLREPPNKPNDFVMEDGYWNMFYVAGDVVSVRWHAVDREWGIFAWGLDGGIWDAGDRVFSLNFHSDTNPSDPLSLKNRVKAIEDIIKHHNL